MDITADLTDLIGFTEAMDRLPDVLRGELADSAQVAIHEGIGYAQEFVPRSPEGGTLAASIVVIDEPDAQGGSYGSDSVYAWQREEGGTIYPRNGEFLVFEIDGELVFAKKVTQEGSHYMQQSMEFLEPRLRPIYQLAIDRTLGVI